MCGRRSASDGAGNGWNGKDDPTVPTREGQELLGWGTDCLFGMEITSHTHLPSCSPNLFLSVHIFGTYNLWDSFLLQATLRKLAPFCSDEYLREVNAEELIRPKLLDSFLMFSSRQESYVWVADCCETVVDIWGKCSFSSLGLTTVMRRHNLVN